MNDREITWIRLQLTLTRWHLDAASSAATEAVHSYLQRARHVYEVSAQALRTCQLTCAERSEFERELSSLGAALEVTVSPSCNHLFFRGGAGHQGEDRSSGAQCAGRSADSSR